MMDDSLSGKTGMQYKPLIVLLLSVIAALAFLYIYNAKKMQADDFALGMENTSRSESWNDSPFTGHSVTDIAAIVSQYSSLKSDSILKQKKIIAWFGNSQLHTINQFKHGEHLAAYWLRKFSSCEDCMVPLGLSLSNANPQEEFVLSQYVVNRIPLQAVLLQAEFMGFREDGLRGEFSTIASPELVDSLREYPVGKELALLANGSDSQKDDVNKKVALDNAAKQDVEGVLTEKLGNVWPLWKDRANLRNNLLGDLFNFRNWALHISSSSQRRIIKPRYQRNMRAFEGMLASLRKAGIPVIVYIAPIRHDRPLPYDTGEYAHWKGQIESLVKTYSATYLNLEELIPAQDWGSNFGPDIDFMHFQEPGHKILAKELYPIIQAKMK